MTGFRWAKTAMRLLVSTFPLRMLRTASVTMETVGLTIGDLQFQESEYGKEARTLKITVIVPTLDEEVAIGQVLMDMPRNVVDELIVVDGSTDATARIAEGCGAKIVLEWRRGYGRALQSGIEKSVGDVVVYIDGDSSYDARDMLHSKNQWKKRFQQRRSQRVLTHHRKMRMKGRVKEAKRKNANSSSCRSTRLTCFLLLSGSKVHQFN